MLPIREIAPAKINLTLMVRGRRPDGYHELESLVTFADVHDVVTLEDRPPGEIALSGPFSRSLDGENLLTRTFKALREIEPRLHLPAAHLEKNLPVAAGLGGGSADAAALLRAVQRANPGIAQALPWHAIAARLGADVPVCLDGMPALMWGIGEKILSVQRLPAAHAVLANPGVPLSTAEVFKALDADAAVQEEKAPHVPLLTSLDELAAYMRALDNDLEKPAKGLRPVIADAKAALAAQPGCLVAAMAGSGPTCFAIFADQAQAEQATARIARTHAEWWVKATVLAGAPS